MHTVLIALLIFGIGGCEALKCFDCYGTGPDHKACTEERTCNGVACMIFDAGDNQTASAFCLLAMKGKKMDEAKDGCWLEPDGKGKHCMCFSDYCNKLIDRRNTNEADPMAPLLPTAEFLKQNPLVDYDAPNLGDYVDEGAHPAPKHVLFPSADKQDPRVAGSEDDDDDLVPVEFEDYKDMDDERNDVGEKGVPLPVDPDVVAVDEEAGQVHHREPEHRRNNKISSSFKPPSWVLFLFPMAASWARFAVNF
ncbi:unnamed protein product [Caenorhabditis bovis]|uniref:Uncharacterized protein n=1 Tax=Caenorhabditis bovis TaxID=2654633 RepID=A0A8S1EB80_9PELO|nr:unnamed protein product [Caenorhabditis bovis]